ncbi:30S ribosomal protein S8 [Patescibacteria group bacterium]|jgi:small subunit ribosomal protein S8|nr:30S ribosomal protein S8 [Patescibacteria group bacterium]
MTDPIADMLTRIRNAVAIKKPEVIMPLSKVKFSIAKLLETEGYIASANTVKEANFDKLKIVLKYDDEKPAISHLKRISKPGQKIYINSKDIPTVLNGYGLAVLSTSKGIMTDRQAKAANIGGELMCEIW